jgi:hypothetical protein
MEIISLIFPTTADRLLPSPPRFPHPERSGATAQSKGSLPVVWIDKTESDSQQVAYLNLMPFVSNA